MFVIFSIGHSDGDDLPRAVPFSEFDLIIGGVLDSLWQRVIRVDVAAAASVLQKVQRRSPTCGNERNYQWENLKRRKLYGPVTALVSISYQQGTGLTP